MDDTTNSPAPKPRDGHSGRFVPGETGNPLGRPRGASKPELVRRKIVRYVHRDLDEILGALVDQAKAGDACVALGLLDLATQAPIEPDRA